MQMQNVISILLLGETLNVQQHGHGLDSAGYLMMDVLVDGRVPLLPLQRIVSMDPYSEYYTQSGPGQIHGTGGATLRIGEHYAIPLK